MSVSDPAPAIPREGGWPVGPGPSWALGLVPFFCLSVTFGATLGFLASGAPLILRVRGVELAEVGLLQLINLPVGLTFLWAVGIDRLRLPILPHRLGWIVLMQGLGIALLGVLSFGEAWPLATLFVLALATCFCLATMDIALEALVVETVGPERRPYVTSAKLGGASLGGLVGAGVLIAAYDRIGWQAAVLTVAGLNALCLLPILLYPEGRLRRNGPAPERRIGLARLSRLSGRVLVLGLYFAALFALTGINSLALIDLGVPLAQVGLVTGSLAAGINLVMAPVSGLLVRRFGIVPLITVSATGVGAAGIVMLGACALGSGGLGIAAAILATLCAGGLGVPVFTMIYRWAQGPQPATDYALLFGAAFFAAMPLRVGAPALAGVVGWPAYFALCLPLYGIAVALLRRVITRTLDADRAAA
ncbi:Anhydromuropeptide permease [Methylorubrum suomiense]|uniref:Anhydromuropeptide permease n=1 Tax=Methylorubrum suomiense TaxID=144191 RepID=A0ABQ4UMT8_9HYPH|nr:MFS transporter [Methylorubrum suomiense]GJE73636.1 Anhydromuropeptide permease [Methylorubrum suomiense]